MSAAKNAAGKWIAAPVIPGHVRHEQRLIVREPIDLRRSDDVLRVLVVGAEAHINAEVVQDRRDLEQQPLARTQALLVTQRVEELRAQQRDMPQSARTVLADLQRVYEKSAK